MSKPRHVLSIILIIGIVFLSCKSKKERVPGTIGFYQENGSSIFDDSLTLVESEEISFPLDSETSVTTNSLEFFNDNGVDYLSFINYLNNSIYVYNYKDRALYKKIKLKIGGPDGLGRNIENVGHHFISLDSIIICHNLTNTVYLIDSSARINKSIKIPFQLGMSVVALDASTKKPMYHNKNKVFIMGNLIDYDVSDHTKVKSVISIDLRNLSISRLLPRPKLYNSGTWSGWQYNVFGTFNSRTKGAVYSFSADPYIIEVDSSSNTKSHYVGSKYFKEIVPYSDISMNNKTVEFRELEKYDYMVPMFSKLVSDNANSLFYRFALLPLTAAEHLDPKQRFYRDETIIILDDHYEKKGEVKLPHKTYSTDLYFTSPDGLLIAKRPELQRSEDEFTFTLFKPKQK